MAAKSTNTKKSSTNNTAKAAKNATTKKTSTAKKASASTKKSSGSKTKRTSNHINTAQSQEIRSEILLLGSLAICILLILSNFGMGGIAGGAISSVGFGLVGAMAYLFPFVFFGAVAFYISSCRWRTGCAPAFPRLQTSSDECWRDVRRTRHTSCPRVLLQISEYLR